MKAAPAPEDKRPRGMRRGRAGSLGSGDPLQEGRAVPGMDARCIPSPAPGTGHRVLPSPGSSSGGSGSFPPTRARKALL